MSSSTEKRAIPPALVKVLEYDKKFTKQFLIWTDKFLPFRQLKMHSKMLEISCHGVPWLACWLAFIYLFNDSSLLRMQVNMHFGLFVDILAVTIIKAATRRRRPVANTDDMLGQLGPDKFSFPSGHASRSTFIAYFFTSLYPLSIVVRLPLYAWATCVSLSRVLLRRHHVLDVVCGIALGLVEGGFIGWLWLGHDTCNLLISWYTDERIAGAEYDV